jgi:hypothetical protein
MSKLNVEKADIVEWISGATLAATIAYVFGMKWGVLILGLYISSVFFSAAVQLDSDL